MTNDPCAELHLLIQADADGELSAADSARIAAHLAGCPACAGLHGQLASLSQRVRDAAPYWPAPDALRTAVLRQLASRAPSPVAVTHAPTVRTGLLTRWRLGLAAPFGAGALAAGLTLALLVPQQGGVSDALVAGHIRALQPGHLMDVASADQHTVKPWFDGRLDFAPPVKDLKPEGFPLMGGRLDYVADRPVAALVYGRRQHVIDLFVWPEGRRVPGADTFEHSGYNVVRWHRDGMVFSAVSDLGAPELAEFARLWTAR